MPRCEFCARGGPDWDTEAVQRHEDVCAERRIVALLETIADRLSNRGGR